MNRKIILIIAAAVMLIVTACTKPKQASADSAVTAPNLSGTDILNGKKVNLSDFKGRIVLVNFFATWCPPCRAEIPDIIKLESENTSNFTVIAVALDQSEADVVNFARNKNLPYPVIMGNNDIVRQWGGIFSIPTSFIINKDGKAVAKYIGGRDYEGWKDVIKPFL